MTEIDNGYFLEAVTEKGKAILDDGAVQDGAAHREEAARRQKAAHEEGEESLLRRQEGEDIRGAVPLRRVLGGDDGKVPELRRLHLSYARPATAST